MRILVVDNILTRNYYKDKKQYQIILLNPKCRKEAVQYGQSWSYNYLYHGTLNSKYRKEWFSMVDLGLTVIYTMGLPILGAVITIIYFATGRS